MSADLNKRRELYQEARKAFKEPRVPHTRTVSVRLADRALSEADALIEAQQLLIEELGAEKL